MAQPLLNRLATLVELTVGLLQQCMTPDHADSVKTPLQCTKLHVETIKGVSFRDKIKFIVFNQRILNGPNVAN